MNKVTIGCVIYTYKKDGTVTRTIDEAKKAAIIAKHLEDDK
jgi:hypothetical protein